MGNKITNTAAQCGALFHRNGVGFDEPAWQRFCEILGMMLPAGSQHERISHADAGGVDLFYEKSPTPATYAYLAAFCKFQEGANKSADTAEGELVVTWSDSGQIVLVSRQDEEGRILRVIADIGKPPIADRSVQDCK